MIPDSEFSKLCFIDKHFRENVGDFSNIEIGVEALREATSMALDASILSKIDIPYRPPHRGGVEVTFDSLFFWFFIYMLIFKSPFGGFRRLILLGSGVIYIFPQTSQTPFSHDRFRVIRQLRLCIDPVVCTNCVFEWRRLY